MVRIDFADVAVPAAHHSASVPALLLSLWTGKNESPLIQKKKLKILRRDTTKLQEFWKLVLKFSFWKQAVCISLWTVAVILSQY